MPNLNIRVKEGYLEEIDKAAAKYGMNRTEFVLTAVEMLSSFDSEFYQLLQQYGKVFRAPVWQVIQNMITRRIAEESAVDEVWNPPGRSYPEFSLYTPDGSMAPYKVLYEHLKSQFIAEETEKKDKKIYGDRED